MKRKSFLFAIVAMAIVSWGAVIAAVRPSRRRVQVFPKALAELPGLIASDPDGNCFVIGEECPVYFEYQGVFITNYRRNKWWGYRHGDAPKEPVMLWLEPKDLLNPSWVTFWKEV